MANVDALSRPRNTAHGLNRVLVVLAVSAGPRSAYCPGRQRSRATDWIAFVTQDLCYALFEIRGWQRVLFPRHHGIADSRRISPMGSVIISPWVLAVSPGYQLDLTTPGIRPAKPSCGSRCSKAGTYA